MTSRHAGVTVDGLTQASSVMPLVRCSDVESGIVTRELVPLNDSAPPNLPAVDQVVFETVPLFPFPDESATVAPEPSLKEYAATRPDGAAGVDAPAVFVYGLKFPAASVARTR